MPKKARTRQPEVNEPGIPRGWGEFLGVALLAIGGLMFGGLVSYQFGDGNLMGPVGRLVASALYAGFGMAGYLVVLGVLGMGVKALLGHRMELNMGEGLGFSAATLAGCVLLHVMFPTYRVHGYTAGGLSGELLGEVSIGLFDLAGTYLLTTTVMCLGLIASTPLSISHLVSGAKAVGGAGAWLVRYLWSGVVGIAEAQREQDWDEQPEGLSEEEFDAALAEHEEELADEDEDELAEAQDEEELAEEAEEAAPARKGRSRRRKAKGQTSTQGKRARKNRKRKQDAEDEAELEDEAEPEEAEAEEQDEDEVLVLEPPKSKKLTKPESKSNEKWSR